MRKVRGQGITHVSSLFEKYKKTLRAPEATTIHTFVAVVEDEFSIPLEHDQCSYDPRTRTLAVRASGVVKTEIALKKRDILARVAQKVGERNAPTTIV